MYRDRKHCLPHFVYNSMTVQRPLCDRGWSLQLTLLVSQLGVVLLILAAVCMPSLAELSAPSGGCTADSCGATPTTLDGNANGSGLRLDADAGIVCSAAVPPPTRVFVPAGQHGLVFNERHPRLQPTMQLIDIAVDSI